MTMVDSTHQEEEKNTVPFYPHHVYTSALVLGGLAVLVLVFGVLGMIEPLGLDEPADPMNTPLHIKAHWYFVFVQEMLKYIPMDIGVVIPVAAIVVLGIWPFIDRRSDTKRARTFRAVLAGVVMLGIGILTYLGLTS
jgi:quinol-cytochrome oxidoreductase complex cytochrome b subunit